MDEVLKRLMSRLTTTIEQRDNIMKSRAAIVEVAKQELRDDLNEEEDTEFRSLTDQVKDLDEEIRKLEERVAELSDEDERTKRAASAQRRVKAVDASLRVNERRTYEPGNGRSYFTDLAKAHILGDGESRQRLNNHAQDVATAQEYRDLTRVDGSGGYFVPPAWLVNQFVELARAGRATANLVTQQQLPAGTDSINVPTLATGTATAIQTADNAVVQETDITDGVVTAPVRTIAGQQDIAIQLLDQSPVNFDEVIFRDLLADYATKLNLQVISGSGASGQVTGIRTQTGTNAVTYTDTTPTVAELYSRIADAVNQVHTNRFLSPTAIVMHPRRWAWFLAALDTSNRPLVVPIANVPNNAMGTFTGLNADGPVGSIMGLPVYADPSIPTNLGAGANEDTIVVFRADDSILWESAPRTRALPDVGSGTLTVRLQVYGYVAFTAGRYAKSISLISGTGLTPPAF